MPDRDRIVAVALLTKPDLALLGEGFRRAYPIEDRHEFDDLLRRIDEADRPLIGTPPGKH